MWCAASAAVFRFWVFAWGIRLSVWLLAGRFPMRKELMHGKNLLITASPDSRLFQGIAQPFTAARYHSLAAVRQTLPDILRVTAEAENGEVMAVEHREYPVFGVQFHPESIMTPNGRQIIKNFLAMGGAVK